jgi:uncharacterized protein (TIGR00369 family)
MSDEQEPAEDFAHRFNSRLGGLNELIGLRFVKATKDELVATVEVTPSLHQPYGLVHGGLYCTIVETLCSAGAALTAMPRGQSTVGLENHTSFIRAVRDGTLTGTARPLTRGRRTQVWEVELRGDDGKLAATGRVRMLNLEAGAAVAGETVRVTKHD